MEVKNMIYAGLGIGNTVSEKTFKVYKNFIESGKNSDPKFSLALENIFENLEDQSKEIKDKVSEIFQTLADKLGYIKLDDYEYLQKRIKTLEADLSKSKDDKK